MSLPVGYKLSSEDQKIIFSFNNSCSIFKYLHSRAGSKKPPTFGMWSKRLAFKSPRLISMVVNGKRLASSRVIAAVSADLGLSPEAQKYLELIVSMERLELKGVEIPKVLLGQIKSLRPVSYRQVKELKAKVISHWYYIPIRQLAKGGCLPYDPKKIATLFRDKVSEAEVIHALSDMEEMGLLTINKEAETITTTAESLLINNTIPSQVIQNYHCAMLELAAQAIKEQSILERSVRALTFKIDESSIPEIKSRIYQFIDSLNQEFYSEDSKSVYQFNSQLFSITRK